MKMFKKVHVALLLMSAALVVPAQAFSANNTVEKVQINKSDFKNLKRAKVVNIAVELRMPDGSSLSVDNMDFCTPGGFYNGVEAIVFGDEAVRIMQAGMAALYPHVGDNVYRLWNNKANEGDPRLPTYLMIKAPGAHNNNKGEANASNNRFGSSAKVYSANSSTPTIPSSCGGYNHPPT